MGLYLMNSNQLVKRNVFITKARIQRKANIKVAAQTQHYNNYLIDKLIEHQYDAATPEALQTATIITNLQLINNPTIFSQYQKIINSEYTNNSVFQEIMAKNLAQEKSAEIVQSELKIITDNIDHVKEIMRTNTIDAEKYAKAAKDITMNRNDWINKYLTEQGVNIKDNVFSSPYKNIDTVAESIHREVQMSSDYELKRLENQEQERLGKDPPHAYKVWVWTGLGMTTRHESNDGQVVPFDETFSIVNDANGDEDELLYPHDPNGSPSNTYNCYCEWETKGDNV